MQSLQEEKISDSESNTKYHKDGNKTIDWKEIFVSHIMY